MTKFVKLQFTDALWYRHIPTVHPNTNLIIRTILLKMHFLLKSSRCFTFSTLFMKGVYSLKTMQLLRIVKAPLQQEQGSQHQRSLKISSISCHLCCYGLSDRQGEVVKVSKYSQYLLSNCMQCNPDCGHSQCDVQHVRNVHRLEMVAGKSEDCRGLPHLPFGQQQYISPFSMNFIKVSDIFRRWTLWSTPTRNKRPRKHTHCRADGIFFFFLITANFNFFSPHETILIAAAFITFSAGRSTSPACATWPAAVTHHCSSQKEKAE